MTRCAQPGCSGNIADGYCDTCGMSPAAPVASVTNGPSVATSPARGGGAPPTSSNPTGGSPGSTMTRGTAITGSTALGSSSIGSKRAAATTSTRRLVKRLDQSRLGQGLVNIPPSPPVDPTKSLLVNAQVAEEKRYCSTCNKAVGRSRNGMPGRPKGFCPSCGSQFDFEPRLKPGTVLNDQYEVMGAIAHGGMGWIYLGKDNNLSGRWVVIKGLVNATDKDLQEAVITEKQFLAEVAHPLIVEIYNFVQHDDVQYIVMEYVGGTSLNDVLKRRQRDSGGTYAPLPPEQAIAYMVEVLPAFSYLHQTGLLYCDFKPANLMQVGDGVKLIDLGGVRRIGDDTSALFGTIGFQAPEVPERGASIPSDVFTIARTLAVLTFEFRGYQSTFQSTLPSPSDVPLLAEYDSYYRLLLKATATAPEDRFQGAEEMREQLIGVLREIMATKSKDASARSVPSPLFEAPGPEPEPSWEHFPALRPDPTDEAADWLAGLTVTEPEERLKLLTASRPTNGIQLDAAAVYLTKGDGAQAKQITSGILDRDPWEWRALWVDGLTSLASKQYDAAIAAFNAVYGQLPGELAPKLALARACELNGELDIAQRLYEVCARTDAAYSALGLFGLARIAEARGDRAAALGALDRVPKTSRSFTESRRQRAEVMVNLNRSADPSLPPLSSADVQAALTEHEASGADTATHAAFRIDIFRRLLAEQQAPNVGQGKPPQGIPTLSNHEVRQSLEKALRDKARISSDRREKVALIDEANRVRPRSLT
jgi:serine/threonine-protein kinase PknG